MSFGFNGAGGAENFLGYPTNYSNMNGTAAIMPSCDPMFPGAMSGFDGFGGIPFDGLADDSGFSGMFGGVGMGMINPGMGMVNPAMGMMDPITARAFQSGQAGQVGQFMFNECSTANPWLPGFAGSKTDAVAGVAGQTEMIRRSQKLTEDQKEIGMADGRINAYLTEGTDENIKVKQQVATLYSAMKNDNEKAAGDLIKKIGKDPEKLAAVELMYGNVYGGGDMSKLRKDARGCFENHFNFFGGPREDEMFEILNKAAKISPRNAALAVKEATEGIGTDEKTLDSVILGATNKEFLAKANESYIQFFGKPMNDDVEDDTSWNYKDRLIEKINDSIGE